MTYVKTPLKREITIDSIITVHYFEYMKDFLFPGESHDFWEFLYVDKGTVSVYSDTKWHTLNKGDIIFHKPNEFHAIKSTGHKSPNLVVMSFTSPSPAMEFFKNKLFTLVQEEKGLISAILSEVRQTFSTPIHLPSIEQVMIKEETPFASEQLIALYLELLLITMKRNHSEDTQNLLKHKQIRLNQKRHDASLIQQIEQYLEFHICDPLDVETICSAFSLSRSALQKLFHENHSCGVMDFFHSMKIKRAKEIILDGTMTITELSFFLSYSSLPHFSKQFKKKTGMSPREYYSSVKGISENFKKTEEMQQN